MRRSGRAGLSMSLQGHWTLFKHGRRGTMQFTTPMHRYANIAPTWIPWKLTRSWKTRHVCIVSISFPRSFHELTGFPQRSTSTSLPSKQQHTIAHSTDLSLPENCFTCFCTCRETLATCVFVAESGHSARNWKDPTTLPRPPLSVASPYPPWRTN